MKTFLVAGVNGFVGGHLAREIHSQGFTIIGTGMDDTLDPALQDIVENYVGNCDLTKQESVQKLPLNDVDIVINLAGLAQVGASFGKEDLYNEVNVKVHTMLVERIKELGKKIRVIAVSTGAVYDNLQTMPLNEDSKLITAGSPYALSKIAMEKALHEYIDAGLDIVVVRPFNHIGPGQLPGFLVPDLVAQVMKSNNIVTGNLETERDYTDVRDVVKAYVSLALKDDLRFNTYNVCSGKSIRGQTILKTISEVSGKDDLNVTVDPARIRPNDPARVAGDNSRLKKETGWEPTIPLEQTLRDFLSSLAATRN